jgi:hypothetical protein
VGFRFPAPISVGIGVGCAGLLVFTEFSELSLLVSSLFGKALIITGSLVRL